MSVRVLLYYKYTSIENAEDYAKEHLEFCKSIGILGRILISNEGINGTVAGDFETTQKYMDYVHADPRFKDLWFKIDDEEEIPFKKIFVRYKPELVNLRLENDVDPLITTGKYLSPKEFRAALTDEDYVIIDARNDYEYDLGHFRGAIRPDIKAFRELPKWIEENKELLEGKKIATYCTGGVRCEKFSGWLIDKGFEDVAQLHGGITTYGKDPEVQGELFDGKMYVFDGRISVDVNRVNPVIVGKDYFDGQPCERYVNCADPSCNKQIICSAANEHKYLRGCTHECRVSDINRYVIENNLSKEEVAERLNKI